MLSASAILAYFKNASRRGDDGSGHIEEPGSCDRYPVMPGHGLQGFHFKAHLQGSEITGCSPFMGWELNTNRWCMR